MPIAMRRLVGVVGHLAAAPVQSQSRGTVVVTGGGRGIGAAICRKLAADGFAVLVNYGSSQQAAEAVVQDIVAAGGTARAVQADVSSESGVGKLFSEFDTSGLPPLVGLVNNAGIAVGGVNLEKVANAAAYHRQMDINVLGPLLCCREALARMGTGHGGGGGNIVNISSGMASLTGAMLYSMSKAALNAMSNNLVQPLARQGIRVNTVSPGMTDTDMIPPGSDVSHIPMGRLGRPDEIADSVAFLLSDRASYITGANIRVSGGKPPGTLLG